MNKLIVLNHKMNMLYDDVYSYISDINKIETDNSIIVCPSSIYLESFINNCEWGVGCQNFYYATKGEYTGEISTDQLKSLGVEYALVGHYERRIFFNESLDDVKNKIEALIDANIMPIFCFGEKEEKDDIDSVINYLDKVLSDVSHIEFITFAYEPYFSVGTGELYDYDELDRRIKSIYKYLSDKYKTVPRIIYGGSVNEKNVQKILKVDELCGIILGASSVKVDFVKKIVKKI